MIASRANQQIRPSIVSAIAIDVMHNFASLQWSTERLFGNLYMHRLRTSFSVRSSNAFSTVDVSTDTWALVCLALSDIAASFTSLMFDHLQRPAIRAWVHGLSIFIARQSFPFRLRVPAFLTISESCFTSGAEQMGALFIMHRTGILQHGAGIAEQIT